MEWIEHGKVVGSDTVSSDSFGVSVAIDGDYAIVGSRSSGNNGFFSGAAYIFKLIGDEWIEEARIAASDGAANDRFGQAVAISGDCAIVGAYGNDANGSNSGAAYIFRRNADEWIQETKITAGDSAGGDLFGLSVSINNNYAIVSSIGDSEDGSYSGSAYIFRNENNEWIEESKIMASDGAAYNRFSQSVAINDDYAFVGASNGDGFSDNIGVVYIFTRDQDEWVEYKRLTASDAETNDRFGVSIDISNNSIIIGATGDDESGIESGAAYLFEYDGVGWIEQNKFTANDAKGFEFFGISVSMSGNSAIIGAAYDDDLGYYSGSAYIFSK
jgi:hypothetical protein